MFFNDRDHAAKRLFDSREWDQPFDTIVPMLRGGYPIAKPLIDHFPQAEIVPATILITSINEQANGKYPSAKLDGELKGNILLVDDGTVSGVHALTVFKEIRILGHKGKVSLAVPAIFLRVAAYLKQMGFHEIIAAKDLRKNWATGALYYEFPDVVLPQEIKRTK